MQTQQYIRSTVNLPVDLHKKLKMEAINRQMTFSAVVLSKLNTGEVGMERDIRNALLSFKKIRQSEPFFDGVQVIRKNRDSGKI